MKFDWFRTSRVFVGMLGAFSGAALIPPLVFAWNFRNQKLSNDIADWGAYGDYYGGILNPMIAFFSLILLAAVTWILARQSHIENFRANLMLKRLEAFDTITTKTLAIESFYSVVYQFAMCIKSFGVYADNSGKIVEALRIDIPKMDAALDN